MTNDIFMGIGPVALTFIAAHLLSMSTIQIGLAISVRELVGSLSQPFFGWLIVPAGGSRQRVALPGQRSG